MLHTPNALNTLAGFIIACCQELAAISCRILQHFRGGYSMRTHLPQLNSDTRYVIAANHQSMLDPFAIFALLPFKARIKLLPLKFMTIPKVFHRWYIKPFAYLLGCFPAHDRDRTYHTVGVRGSVAMLKSGYNICIFPEGTRTLQVNSNPKPGIVQILQEFPDAKLLLAHLEWKIKPNGKKHVHLIVAPAPASLDKTDPKAIMDAIYAL